MPRELAVSVISPERVLFEGTATAAVVPAFDGEVGILPQHAPLMTLLGRGTLVRAGSVVRGEFPDFAVLDGRPARVVGDTRAADAALLAAHPAWRPLREAWAGPPAPAQPPRP